ncbi:MAG: ABC transporter ATP-binding protein [Methanomassiliicoccales archaeon]|jgi:ABC-2 type transport system ATP-binding protein|nr:ABC transporter ATP-binding protein [Methanomassiliicoccales archaeon]
MSETVIEVNNLTKRYGDLVAVDSISFTVNKGEIFSLLGPNGAGKTTTVEILECLRSMTSGEAKVLGLDVAKKAKEIKRQIGVLPQDFNAFDLLTVRENIEFFGSMYEHMLDPLDLIKTMDLEEKTNEYFKNLSGGLKQRVGVAIAMVNDPEIVFLDEPTTGLDPKARREVWKVIEGLKKKGKTVILTTHYMEEAEILSDRVGIIDHGRFLVLDTPLEIINKYGSGSRCIVSNADERCRCVIEKQWPGYEIKNGNCIIALKNRSDLFEIIYALDRSGGTYEQIQVTRPTLEDVFLKLTGRKLAEGGEIEYAK